MEKVNQIHHDVKSGLEIFSFKEGEKGFVAVRNHHTGCKVTFDLVTWDLVGKYFGPKAKKEIKPGGEAKSK